jgi:hypothetical protein
LIEIRHGNECVAASVPLLGILTAVPLSSTNGKKFTPSLTADALKVSAAAVQLVGSTMPTST